jgi:hypothetical protein
MTRIDATIAYAGRVARRTSASRSSTWDRMTRTAVARSVPAAGFRNRSTSSSTSSPRRMLAGVEPHIFRKAAHVSSSTATRVTRAPTARRLSRGPAEREGGEAGGAGAPVAASSGSATRHLSCRGSQPRYAAFTLQTALSPDVGSVAPLYTLRARQVLLNRSASKAHRHVSRRSSVGGIPYRVALLRGRSEAKDLVSNIERARAALH